MADKKSDKEFRTSSSKRAYDGVTVIRKGSKADQMAQREERYARALYGADRSGRKSPMSDENIKDIGMSETSDNYKKSVELAKESKGKSKASPSDFENIGIEIDSIVTTKEGRSKGRQDYPFFKHTQTDNTKKKK